METLILQLVAEGMIVRVCPWHHGGRPVARVTVERYRNETVTSRHQLHSLEVGVSLEAMIRQMAQDVRDRTDSPPVP